MTSKIVLRDMASNTLKENYISSFPVPLIKIVKANLYQIKEVEMQEDGGVSFQDRIIFINNSHPEFKKRFTLAHELGHIFIHKNTSLFDQGKDDMYYAETTTPYWERDEQLRGDDRIEDDSIEAYEGEELFYDRDAREKDADKFASFLLMPDAWVLAEWRKVNNIQLMANKFDVSRLAMSIKLKDLRLIA